ncbi:hypothetical protein B0H16DRAFT_1597537, partial [Mycena metata]
MNYILGANYPYLRPQALHHGDNCSNSMIHPHVLAYGGIRLLPAKEQQLSGGGYESGDIDWLYSLRHLVGNPNVLAIGHRRHLFTVNDNWLVGVWNDLHVGIAVRDMVFFLFRLVFQFPEENWWFRTVIFFPDAGGVVRGECEKGCPRSTFPGGCGGV